MFQKEARHRHVAGTNSAPSAEVESCTLGIEHDRPVNWCHRVKGGSVAQSNKKIAISILIYEGEDTTRGPSTARHRLDCPFPTLSGLECSSFLAYNGTNCVGSEITKQNKEECGG